MAEEWASTLAVYVVSWCPAHRPARVEHLALTLQSLFLQIGTEPRLKTAVHLVDNGSCPEALAVIDRFRPRLGRVICWPENRGINQAYEAIMPETPEADFAMALDGDVEILDPLSPYIQILKQRPDVGAAGGQHSPEHETLDVMRCAGRGWALKRYERGAFMVFRTAELNQMRPFPVDRKTDWDWHVCQWSSRSIEKQGKRVAVLIGGARHLGWRAADSTWMNAQDHREWSGLYPDVPDDLRPVPTSPTGSELKSVREVYECALRDATDILEHLPVIAALASGVDSAATIGHSVETTIALLQAGVPMVRNYHYDDRTAVAVKSIKHGSDFRCFVCDTARRAIELTDLLAIDSIHTYAQLRAELFLNVSNVRKTIIIHDTVTYGETGEDGSPGLCRAIDEFLSANPNWIVTERLSNNNGLTVLSRRRTTALAEATA